MSADSLCVSAGASSCADASERRARPDLRAIFESAYRVVFPLLDPKQNPSLGSPAHFVRIVLHEAFPDLHQQDISILSVAIERVFRERSKSECR
ncbi:MAG: hypothetical protein KJ795_13170 [Gammaproteobacteria bacterium]|nr:hypothetical protein [Gammaproteobacteria bacterium]MBU1777674.1 hypothetical protein [Gammaproteobacteria bacterium]MBU1968329.1 hypothetical protein [Gammaproteobacteria bacterium]